MAGAALSLTSAVALESMEEEGTSEGEPENPSEASPTDPIHKPSPESGASNSNTEKRSWKEVCEGTKDFDRLFIKLEDFHGKVSIEFHADSKGVPVITFDKSIIERLVSAWKLTVIFRPIGTKIAYEHMAIQVQEIFKIKGIFKLIDISKGYFLLKLQDKDDYHSILTGGPWCVFGHYLVVQPWTAEFDTLTAKIERTPVWVRIVNLPMLFYEENTLLHIVSSIGEPIRVDLKTLFADRVRFARVCVNVDLSKPLVNSMIVQSEQEWKIQRRKVWIQKAKLPVSTALDQPKFSVSPPVAAGKMQEPPHPAEDSEAQVVGGRFGALLSGEDEETVGTGYESDAGKEDLESLPDLEIDAGKDEEAVPAGLPAGAENGDAIFGRIGKVAARFPVEASLSGDKEGEEDIDAEHGDSRSGEGGDGVLREVAKSVIVADADLPISKMRSTISEGRILASPTTSPIGDAAHLCNQAAEIGFSSLFVGPPQKHVDKQVNSSSPTTIFSSNLVTKS